MPYLHSFGPMLAAATARRSSRTIGGLSLEVSSEREDSLTFGAASWVTDAMYASSTTSCQRWSSPKTTRPRADGRNETSVVRDSGDQL
ncbi:hypothetical protein D3C87_1962510 [compost metagenome]